MEIVTHDGSRATVNPAHILYVIEFANAMSSGPCGAVMLSENRTLWLDKAGTEKATKEFRAYLAHCVPCAPTSETCSKCGATVAVLDISTHEKRQRTTRACRACGHLEVPHAETTGG